MIKSLFFLLFAVEVAALIFVDSPLSVGLVVILMTLSGLLIAYYHQLNPKYERTSTSQFKKILIISPLVMVISLFTILSSDVSAPLRSFPLWYWLSVLSLFHFDTFRSSLSYFGKQRPLVTDVRTYYHFSLFILHFGVGAAFMAIYSAVGLAVDNDYITGTAREIFMFGAVAVVFLAVFVYSWHVYRKAHASGERSALKAFGAEFSKQYKSGIASALKPEERSKYV
tara:strand:+ start:233 stop:910 length:678 start_codon:yes stop_codon:yes gene_type:complete